MKQVSIFEESRPEMFKRLFESEMDDMRENFLSRGGWVRGATRKRARSLARLQARHNMRLYRQQEIKNENSQ